ncbi:hypothetical protein GQ457_12G000280 [Hibiscus cannabinus]
MQCEFEMSMMGELSFFLGLQIKQKKDAIFINQAKYIKEKLKKFGMENVKPQATPMSSSIKLDKDEEGKCVDSKLYRSMIGLLFYFTASRPDIIFSVCLCARFQANPKESHLKAVKRIFRYLQDTPSLGLWYSRESTFDLNPNPQDDDGAPPKPPPIAVAPPPVDIQALFAQLNANLDACFTVIDARFTTIDARFYYIHRGFECSVQLFRCLT